MKKILLIILALCIAAVVIVALVGMDKFNSRDSESDNDINGDETQEAVNGTDPKNATYLIEGQPVTLVNGFSEKIAAPESTTMVISNYFGNEVYTDLNNDGREDIVFLLTQSPGGSGSFFYVVAALNTETGWRGSQGFFLGDRIAPQTTELSQNPNQEGVIVVNYADREKNQPMTEQPSVAKSVWLKLDLSTMTFGEVEQNFSGEADPDSMTLEMKPWIWVNTTYNDDSKITPKKVDAFSLTFNEDNTVSVKTDCNNMSGSYQADENELTFMALTSTLMFCEDSQEQEFSQMLSEVDSYHFTSKGELMLDLKLDSGVATFR